MSTLVICVENYEECLIVFLFFISIQDTLKSEITKLENEVEAMEKQLSQTKANFIQQIKTLEAESKQKLESAKSLHEENCLKFEQEKVHDIREK